MLFAFVFLQACNKPTVATTGEPDAVRPLPPVTGSRIAWDHASLRKISTATSGYSGYARMAVLPDGSWFCVYEETGNIVGIKSTDNGHSWGGKVTIAAREDGTNMAVPDLLVLNDGSLLVCYNPRPYRIDTARKFAIRTVKSYDGGNTFTDNRLLYEAGYEFGNGCWEPAAIQLPSGEIQLYFANEGIYTQSDEQNISLLRSVDNGLSWTGTPEIVSFREGSRDGMPSPLLNRSKNRIFFAIEDNGFTNFKPYIITNTLDQNWSVTVSGNSADRHYALADSLGATLYAGAPYLRQLSTGELVLSYQGTEGRTNRMEQADMKVVIGSERANDFNRRSVPFRIPPAASALWSSLCVPDDTTVIALTSTNAYSGAHSEVWMIKGRVIKEFPVTGSYPVDLPVFMGHTGLAQAHTGFRYDADGLYVKAMIKDGHTGTAGWMLYLDPRQKSLSAPAAGIYRIRVSTEGQVTCREGDAGAWKPVELKGVLAKVDKTGSGYTYELLIPWSQIGGKTAAGNRVGYHLVLLGKEPVDSVIEHFGSNDPDKPYTWSGFTLENRD